MIRGPLSLPVLVAALAACLLPPSTAAAQPLGTFRWQLQPYCNVVVVTVVQQGGQYQLDGTEDRCGATTRSSVRGLAFLNPDGSIGFGLTTVPPDGRAVTIGATISLATLSGTWQAAGGAFSGTFVFTPGAGTGGSPLPPIGTGVYDIVAGAGLIGGGGTGQVQLDVDFGVAQRRVTATCPAGQLMTGVNQNGSVICQSVTGAGGGDITAVTAGIGLTGGGTTGDVGLAVAFGNSGAANVAARSDHTHAVGVTNTAIGPLAFETASGNNNVAVGRGALRFNGNVSGNTAVGADALGVNNSTNNTAVGFWSLATNTTGGNNSALGSAALYTNTVGIQNTAVGGSALYANVTGSQNTAVGVNALSSFTSGARNTGVGVGAGGGSLVGSDNTAVGESALSVGQTGDRNTAVGVGALRSNASSGITAVGYFAARANTTGVGNVAVGYEALAVNTTGGFNSGLGYRAAASNTTGVVNTAVGYGALVATTVGGYNTAVGGLALGANTTGGGNTALGAEALSTITTGEWSTALGEKALFASTGSYNTAVGNRAMWNTTTGTFNVAVGVSALSNNSTGQRNTAVGLGALADVTTGGGNIAIGYDSGLGLFTGSNNILIGANLNAASPAESNTIRIGDGTTSATFIGGISGRTSSGGAAVFVNANGQLGTITSSARFKEQVTPLDPSLGTRLRALTPVSFYYKPEFDDGSRQIQYGLIAEEVAETFPELLVRDADGRPQTVRYHLLTPLLLAEVQRLEQARAAAEATREALEARVRVLETALTALLDRAKH